MRAKVRPLLALVEDHSRFLNACRLASDLPSIVNEHVRSLDHIFQVQEREHKFVNAKSLGHEIVTVAYR